MAKFYAKKSLPTVISMGESAGIGPDLILQCYLQRKKHALSAFYVHGNAAFLRERALTLGLDVPLQVCTPQDASDVFINALPVVEYVPHTLINTPGVICPSQSLHVAKYIEHSVGDIFHGYAGAFVTAPIQKSAMNGVDFNFPGHTEYLAHLAKKHTGQNYTPVMLIWSEQLAVVPLTIHMALADVSAQITQDLILKTCRIVDESFKTQFGITKPRLAVCGLNPHAGEGGLFGHEDSDIIAPALHILQTQGIDAKGPYPADTLFTPHARKGYDVAIGMYHDQVLIPVKTLAFDEGVNCTLGLPFVRTSPDHGTAFDLAGTGKANAASFVAAIKLAQK